jgi:hypothetical protein
MTNYSRQTIKSSCLPLATALTVLLAPTAIHAQPAPSRDSSDATTAKPAAEASPTTATRSADAPKARPDTARPEGTRPAAGKDESPQKGNDGKTDLEKSKPNSTDDSKEDAAQQTAGRDARAAETTAAGVKKKAKTTKKKDSDGWSGMLKASFNTALVHNKNVPGLDDGLNATLGVTIDSQAKYTRKKHTFLTTLKLVHTQTKTPTVKPFIKTADELNIKSLYAYDLDVWHKLSPFFALQLIAPLFPGNLVYAEDTPLIKNELDGTTRQALARANEPYEINPAFSPLTFKQILGIGAKPSEDPMASLDLKISFVGQEIWAQGYTINDDADTDEIDLDELQNYQQLGPQIEIALAGKLKKKLTYGFAAEFMFPVYTSVDTELSGFNLLNADISFKVGVEITKWASLNYQFSAKRTPLILDEWQILNNLVFSLTANVL